MFTKTKMALAATLVLGSASLALADGYEDQAADAIRNFGPVTQSQPVAHARNLTTRNVALPQAPSAASERWMDRASENVDGGGD